MTTPTAPTPLPVPGFARRFWPVWLAGLLGVLSLALQAPPPGLVAQSPELLALPPFALRLLLLVNPFLLLTLLALAGAALAHRSGLQSRLAGTAAPLPAGEFGRQLLAGAGAGVALGLALGALDWGLAPRLGPEWEALAERAEGAPVAASLALGLLYGGLAEEVMLRWGVMSLVLAALLAPGGRLGAPGRLAERPGPVAAGVAIVVAALLFAAAHLPSLGLSVTLTPEIVARTLGLNLLAGLLYGWLFWRRGLEVAMAAHAATHLGFALLRLA